VREGRARGRGREGWGGGGGRWAGDCTVSVLLLRGDRAGAIQAEAERFEGEERG
jgi:hypothetical protein